MGSWDVYCAFCGSALCGAQVAEKPRSARFRRRRQREQRDAATANEEGSQSDAENESGDQEESEGEDDDDDCSIESCDEEHSYDPAILDEKDLEWTKSVYILGFNPYASSIRKTFIAGPGHYWDYGSVEIDAGQSDPNQPDDGDFTCYYSIESGELPVFPFHWCCYELLLRILTGTTDTDKLDRDLLYNIMHELAPDYAKALELDYGDPCPDQDQFWCSNAGEEVLVVQPSLNPEITSLLRGAIAEDTFKKTDSADMSLNLESRISNDPFSKLPYDILYKVCASLPFGSISGLSIASWLVNVTLRSTDGLWKHLLRNSMPWFFELHDLLDDEKLMENRDFRKLFIWIEKMTRPRLWMDGPFMGVANRRRIWGVCEQLAERYHARLEQRNNEDGLDETAKLIMKHSDNPHMPLVIYPPQTVSVETTSTQWVRSWTELDSPVAIFETFWDTQGSLTGLAMSFLGNRRVFGQDDTMNGVTRSVLPIEEPSQLNGFILHLRQVDEETSIKGITVVHDYFSSDLGMPDPTFSQRPLLINKGKKLVGVVGQIANGKICRLGLIQCPRPPRDVLAFLDLPSPESDIPEQQKLLWKSDLSHILKNGPERIWNHERLRIIPSADTGSHLRDIPDDLLPYEALLWATESKEMRNVKCLSGYVNVGGTVSTMSQIDERKWVTRDYHDICGARMEFVPEYDQPKRFVGKDREIDGDWKEENMVHFPIDGPGGEVVTRVDVSGGGLRKGLKLFTNRGRETHWGEKDAVNWETLEAPQGENIVGLVMAFGVMSGPVSEDTGKRHQTAMSYAAIMTLPHDVQWMDPA